MLNTHNSYVRDNTWKQHTILVLLPRGVNYTALGILTHIKTLGAHRVFVANNTKMLGYKEL